MVRQQHHDPGRQVAGLRHGQLPGLAGQHALSTRASSSSDSPVAPTTTATPAFARTDLIPGTTYTHDWTDDNGPEEIVRTFDGATPDVSEMTNYANWFAYYRTRIQAVKTVTSASFSDIDVKYRVGFHAMFSAVVVPEHRGFRQHGAEAGVVREALRRHHSARPGDADADRARPHRRLLQERHPSANSAGRPIRSFSRASRTSTCCSPTGSPTRPGFRRPWWAMSTATNVPGPVEPDGKSGRRTDSRLALAASVPRGPCQPGAQCPVGLQPVLLGHGPSPQSDCGVPAMRAREPHRQRPDDQQSAAGLRPVLGQVAAPEFCRAVAGHRGQASDLRSGGDGNGSQ